MTATTRRLVADSTAGVQVTEELKAATMNEVKPGTFIFDLKQNMVGWARLRVQGSAGATATLRFGEVLNPDGTLYTENLRAAKATDTYTLRGGAEEIYEPRFTFHGFRYVELTGNVMRPTVASITGIVAHSAMPVTGTFTTSSALVNQLQSNIVWGQRGNFVSVPTDCPQRDERLGWMGDALIFARTATFNTDVASFYTKWLRDVDEAQSSAGVFANVSPMVPGNASGSPAWSDAGVIIPWTVYLAYGDTRILEEHYPAMVRWIEHVRGANPNLLWQMQRGNDYGDWLSIADDTDKELLATAFFAHSVDLVSRAAKVLKNETDATKYAMLFSSIKDAFDRAYVGADSKIKSDTQTAYALALRFGLLPDAQRGPAAKFLADNVARHTNHLSTGFVGVSHLLPALTSQGNFDLAYQLLNSDTYPSWGYEIRKGATTIWERWDGIKTDGTFQTPTMNSFNHYSFGSVGEWMYSVVAGIELDESQPGFKQFKIRPHPGGGLTSASGKLESIHGTIVSDWKIEAGMLTLKVQIPVNTSAVVYLPWNKNVLESGAPPPPPAADGGYALGSGSYVFTATQ
jgi:alpha-L-rhamnosidase